GTVDGLVHSHRFPGANTAVPAAEEDPGQPLAGTKVLKEKQRTVGNFGVGAAGKKKGRFGGKFPPHGAGVSASVSGGRRSGSGRAAWRGRKREADYGAVGASAGNGASWRRCECRSCGADTERWAFLPRWDS